MFVVIYTLNTEKILINGSIHIGPMDSISMFAFLVYAVQIS